MAVVAARMPSTSTWSLIIRQWLEERCLRQALGIKSYGSGCKNDVVNQRSELNHSHTDSRAAFARATHSQAVQLSFFRRLAKKVGDVPEVVDRLTQVGHATGTTVPTVAVGHQQGGRVAARVVVDDPGPGAVGQLGQQVGRGL